MYNENHLPVVHYCIWGVGQWQFTWNRMAFWTNTSVQTHLQSALLRYKTKPETVRRHVGLRVCLPLHIRWQAFGISPSNQPSLEAGSGVVSRGSSHFFPPLQAASGRFQAFKLPSPVVCLRVDALVNIVYAYGTKKCKHCITKQSLFGLVVGYFWFEAAFYRAKEKII